MECHQWSNQRADPNGNIYMYNVLIYSWPLKLIFLTTLLGPTTDILFLTNVHWCRVFGGKVILSAEF